MLIAVVGDQRIHLDVHPGLQQLYTTRRDLPDAKHRYLLAYLRLDAATGVVKTDDLIRIAAFIRHLFFRETLNPETCE